MPQQSRRDKAFAYFDSVYEGAVQKLVPFVNEYQNVSAATHVHIPAAYAAVHTAAYLTAVWCIRRGKPLDEQIINSIITHFEHDVRHCYDILHKKMHKGDSDSSSVDNSLKPKK